MANTPTGDLNNTSQSATVKPKSKKLPTDCKICGALALYSYFGVVVCSSCKIFFRRNAQKKQGCAKCLYDSHCNIDINNRHICTCCRLAKCFASGMQAEMIRARRTATSNTTEKQQMTTVSTVSVTRKGNDQPAQLPTVNLLRSDQSTLSINDWNVVSNLTHCYDERSGSLIADHFIQKQNELPPKMRFKMTSVVEFFTSIVSQSQVLYEKNADFVSISPHDRSLLLHKTIKYVAAIGPCLIARYSQVLDNPAFYESAENIYGANTLANSNRALDLLDADGTFVKLVLALLTFSTFDQTYYTKDTPDNLKDVSAILRIQDMYTDIAWRYVTYKCGHQRAVKCFSNLIRCLFSLNNSLVESQEHTQYTDMIDLLIKQTEDTFTLTE